MSFKFGLPNSNDSATRFVRLNLHCVAGQRNNVRAMIDRGSRRSQNIQQ